MSATRGRRRQSMSKSKDKITEEKPSQLVLKGDQEVKYTNGQLVWAKFSKFPWWPGTVILPHEDEGRPRLTIHWFGNAGEQSNDCLRKKIIPFDPELRNEISKEVKTGDLVLFDDSVDAAVIACQRSSNNGGSQASTGRRRSLRRRSLPGVPTNGDANSTEQNTQTSSPSKRFRRRSIVSSSTRPEKTEESTPAVTTPSTMKRGRRLSKQTPQQQESPSKKASFVRDSGSISNPVVEEETQNTKAKEREQEKEKENTPEIMPGGRRRSVRIHSEMSVKRRRCLQMTTSTHEPDDLSVFIAHQYYSYLEDGKTPLDALSLVAQKWEMKSDAVLDHLNAYEYESNKPQNKRARRGA